MTDAAAVGQRPALDGERVLSWVAGARSGLAQARAGIDAVNVFPVADADTGTNAWLTVEGGARAVDERVAAGPAPAADLLTTFARGAMLAARGNSGVILSQWLAGFARRAGPLFQGPGGARELADALTAAARAARLALADPQEGTVLSLADEVAEAASLAADALSTVGTAGPRLGAVTVGTGSGTGADGDVGTGSAIGAGGAARMGGEVGVGGAVGAVAAQAAAAGHQALARISASHPVLRRAHVPDAGACALLVVLDALGAALRGAPVPDVSGWLPGAARAAGAQAAEPVGTSAVDGGSDPSSAGPGTGQRSGQEAAQPAGRPDRHEHCADGGAFEVMLVVREPHGTVSGPDDHDATGDGLRAALGTVGGSVAVVGADGWWHAHVHTDDPAAAIAACAADGRVREQVVVRRLDVVESGVLPAADWRPVVVTPSAGLAAWYATAGAVVVVRSPEAPVTTTHLRRAVEDADGRAVVLTSGVVPPDVVVPLLEEPPGRPGTVEVVATADEARTAVAVLAFVTHGGGPGGVAAAARAAAGARVVTVDPAVVEDVTSDGLDAVVGRLADDEPGAARETLTAVVPAVAHASLVGRLEAAAARHGLEATVLVGAAPPTVLLAVD